MSSEQLQLFIEKVKSDNDLAEKLKGVQSDEQVIAIAKELGFTITNDDLESLLPEEQDLTEDQLEAVAGGFGFSIAAVGIAIHDATTGTQTFPNSNG